MDDELGWFDNQNLKITNNIISHFNSLTPGLTLMAALHHQIYEFNRP